MRTRTIGSLAALALAIPLAGAALAQGTDVEVVDNAYEPETLTVTAGDTVTWTQTGSNPHTVTADDGSFDSHPNCESFSDSAGGACMDDGETFEQAFDEPGTYAYYCKYHGAPGGNGMAGTIVVEAAASTGGDTTGGDTTGGDTTGDSTTGDSTSEEPAVTGSITVSDQTGDGGSVTVDSVTIEGAPGFVVIHADGDGQPGAVIGHLAIPEGTSTDVSVALDSALTADATVWPMLHVDAGTPGTYEFPGADGPVMDSEGVVVEPLSYTVAAGDTLPRTGVALRAALGLLAALAIGGGLLLLRRRPRTA